MAKNSFRDDFRGLDLFQLNIARNVPNTVSRSVPIIFMNFVFVFAFALVVIWSHFTGQFSLKFVKLSLSSNCLRTRLITPYFQMYTTNYFGFVISLLLFTVLETQIFSHTTFPTYTFDETKIVALFFCFFSLFFSFSFSLSFKPFDFLVFNTGSQSVFASVFLPFSNLSF